MTEPLPNLNQPDAAILALLAGGASTARIVDIGGHRGTWTAADVRRVAASRDKPAAAQVKPAPQDTSDLLTVPEISAVLRISPMSVYRLIHGGELDGFRFGRSLRVRRSVLDAYIARAQT